MKTFQFEISESDSSEEFKFKKESKKSTVQSYNPIYCTIQEGKYRHNCITPSCYDFKNTQCEQVFPTMKSIRIKKDKKFTIEQTINYVNYTYRVRESEKLQQRKKKIIKTRYQKKAKILTVQQREEIASLMKKKIKIGFIAAMYGTSIGQIRNNEKALTSQKSKFLISESKNEKNWLITHSSMQTNNNLYSAHKFYSQFKQKFPQSEYSLSQFRQLLHQYDIRFRIPSLRPFQCFKKNNSDLIKYMINVCTYNSQGYNLVFIALSSSQQSKNQIQRNNLNTFIKSLKECYVNFFMFEFQVGFRLLQKIISYILFSKIELGYSCLLQPIFR